jgi:hypothetical protein
VVELAPHSRLVLDLDTRTDLKDALDDSSGQWPAVADRPVLPRGHALIVEAQRNRRRREHMDVHQPATLRPEHLVKARTEALRFSPRAWLRWKQPVLHIWRAPVYPREDLSRIPDRALRRHKHRHCEATARTPRDEAVDCLHMALLFEVHPRPVERPPRLFAVVANRDRDESQHRRSVWRGQRYTQLSPVHLTSGGVERVKRPLVAAATASGNGAEPPLDASGSPEFDFACRERAERRESIDAVVLFGAMLSLSVLGKGFLKELVHHGHRVS